MTRDIVFEPQYFLNCSSQRLCDSARVWMFGFAFKNKNGIARRRSDAEKGNNGIVL